jgi:glycopeptide antibiotics resistance protein
MRQHILRWLQADFFFKAVALLATTVLSYFMLIPPGKEVNSWIDILPGKDLFAHLMCYFLLTLIYFAAFFTHTSVLKKSLLLSLLVGFVLECLQLIHLFERSFDYKDLIANIAGSFIGILTIRFFFSDSVKE